MSPTFVLRQVSLVTRSLDRLLPFYCDTLGLVARRPDARTLSLHFSAASPAVITFTEEPAAVEPAGRVAGLFHIALLVPDRPTLAAVLARLIEHHQPLEGLSDHGVSEAIYLADPDGNGLEIYRDRPRADWPMAGERVAMFTRTLDPRGLLRDLPKPPPPHPSPTRRSGMSTCRSPRSTPPASSTPANSVWPSVRTTIPARSFWRPMATITTSPSTPGASPHRAARRRSPASPDSPLRPAGPPRRARSRTRTEFA